MKISLVVPAFNEELLLAGTLENLGAASAVFARRGWAVELIVCDNNSTDRTAEIARAAGAQVVFEAVNQIGRARNRGAAAATGDWLIFVDADSSPSEALFAEVAAAIEGGRCLAGGATVRLDESHRLGGAIAQTWNLFSRAGKWLAGSFIFVEAAAFRRLGGFDDRFFAGEEVDLSRRLRRLARAQGRTVVILHRHPLVTSARKLRLYSAWDQAAPLLRAAWGGGTLACREACGLWYDGKR
jgi:glycosyltransferase involved in cell wall biosynthesis